MIAALLLVVGALNPAVTEATIQQTICTPGWAERERKAQFPEAKSEAMKRRLFHAQHATGRLRDYELDHRIPISLGGCVTCEANLWLEPLADAKRKDRQEWALHRAVCAGQIRLHDAQETMRRWPKEPRR